MTRNARGARQDDSTRSTTRSGVKRSTAATPAVRSSKTSRKVAKKLNSLDPDERLALVLCHVAPLLELFADIDDIFTEDDALAPAKRQMGIGRAYRAWKKCRTAMDPNFAAMRDLRVETNAPSLRLPDGTVLQPRRRRAQRDRPS